MIGNERQVAYAIQWNSPSQSSTKQHEDRSIDIGFLVRCESLYERHCRRAEYSRHVAFANTYSSIEKADDECSRVSL